MKSKVVPELIVANLDSLLIDVSGKDDAEIERLGREVYERIYITGLRKGIHKTHDGEDVTFFSERFKHAFCKTINGKKTDKIDTLRVARLRWILPFISGEVEGTECWLVPDDDGSIRRLYLHFGKNFVTWLKPRLENDGWRFSSAYIAPLYTIRGYTRGCKLLWKHGWT